MALSRVRSSLGESLLADGDLCTAPAPAQAMTTDVDVAESPNCESNLDLCAYVHKILIACCSSAPVSMVTCVYMRSCSPNKTASSMDMTKCMDMSSG